MIEFSGMMKNQLIDFKENLEKETIGLSDFYERESPMSLLKYGCCT